MSSIDQPVDAQLIEQTKRQIQSLVAEIAELSKRSVTPGEFYGEFLNRVVSALAAIGGVVWTTNDQGQLALQYQVNLQQTNLPNDEDAQRRHSQLLYKAMAQGQGMIVPPHSGFGEGGDGDEAANPTEFLLVLGPLRTDLEPVGLVEIFQRTEAAPNIQQGYLRFLLQMCDLAGEFLKSHQLRHFSDRQVLWARLEEFARGVHASLEPIQTAYTIANEGRRLIECDRVSVAIRRGNRCTIEAVSGQDVFDKRSNTVRLLGKLATAVVATGDPVWYAGDTRDLAPQVEDAIQEYVDEAHSKMIAVLPLGRPKPDQEADAAEREAAEEPIGALVVEQIEDNRVASALTQRIEVVCRHSSTALANAMEHQSLFLMPVWRTIGKSRVLVKARTLPKTLSIGGGVLAVLLVLFIWPARFELHSPGTLEPVDRRDVFAAVDGVVAEIAADPDRPDRKIEHGTGVKSRQLLLKLRNTVIKNAMTEIKGERDTAVERVLGLQRLVNDNTLRPEEQVRVLGDLAEAREKLHGLEAQLKVQEKNLEDLAVVSPIDGMVVTWDLENRLMGRPVQKGQALLRVANPKGKWQLELHMPEDRMGHIVRARQNLGYGDELPVSYILATEPGTTRQGTIREIAESAEVRPEEGNTVLIKVEIDTDEIPEADRRPGATVTAKVYCGRRSLGYVWFHDLFAFVQSRILFR
ncbi:MAG: HlyD family efflux transporter periplasmic adaptor subunit, partial [Thermoguttaceae bacterium]